MDAASELSRLAKEKFGELTAAEKKLFDAVANGEFADYSSTNEKKNNPAEAAKWDRSRILSADRLTWLCTNKQASQLVTHKGIQVKGARIDGEFDLLFAKLSFPLRFDRCKCTAEIVLGNAQMAALVMPGTHTYQILADGLKAEGDVFLRNGFKAEGEVRLLGAEIGGNLECDKGQFVNKGGDALCADRLTVKGDVLLRDGFKAAGHIVFAGARIGHYFCITNVDSPESMALDLTSAKIGVLHDDRESWPAFGGLVLHGLEYEEISRRSPRDSKTGIEWLRLQDGFWPQPYEQLAKVLRESGDGAGARDVLVAKNKDRAKRTKLTLVEKCWFRFFGPLIGYGHKPWLALPLALVIILFGSVFFKEGYSHDLVTPLSESAYVEDNTGAPRISEVYPVFHSFVYSTDVFVPVVDLRQADYWLPNPNRGPAGWLLLFWLWFETACGWVLTTLFLVGLTGLVRT